MVSFGSLKKKQFGKSKKDGGNAEGGVPETQDENADDVRSEEYSRGAQSEGDNDDEFEDANVDTSHVFNSSLIFGDKEEAVGYAFRTGEANNIYLIRQTKRDDGEVILTCERYGKHRPRVSTGESSSSSQRPRRATKKCNCPFLLSIRGGVQTGWSVLVMVPTHNHALARNPQSHFVRPRFSVDERASMKSLYRSGVVPRQMWAHLHDKNPESTADKTSIHNLVSKFRKEDRGGRTDVASFMHSLDERNYSWWSEKDARNPSRLGLVLFAHPFSLTLVKMFPYVVLIDSTYKTNMYKVPLVEFIGVTLCGKNFCIAFCFAVREDESAYTWMLNQLTKVLIYPPNVFVTDNEKALVKALSVVYPSVPHLLCRWHICKNVAANALKIMHIDCERVNLIVHRWKRLVYASTIAKYDEQYGKLVHSYGANNPFVVYLNNTWLCRREKFCEVWVKRFRHFGNTSTNRAESAHSALKCWLHTSTGSLDTCFDSIHRFVEGQHFHIKQDFEFSIDRRVSEDQQVPFLFLVNQVSLKCLEILQDQLRSGRCDIDHTTSYEDVCVFTSTMGLPCAFRMFQYIQAGLNIPVEEVHIFWRTLRYDAQQEFEAQRQTYDESYSTEEQLSCVGLWYDDLSQRYDPTTIEQAFNAWKPIWEPEDDHTGLQPPEVKVPKGRPTTKKKKRPNTRDKSEHEHLGLGNRGPPLRRSQSQRRSTAPQSTSDHGPSMQHSQSQRWSSERMSQTGEGPTMQHNPPQQHAPYPTYWSPWKYSSYWTDLDPQLGNYIIGYREIVGDGNCGFRAIADAVYNDERLWKQVRRACLDELEDRRDWWLNKVERVWYDRQYHRLNWFADTFAPSQYWIEILDIGVILCTVYHIALISFSKGYDGKATGLVALPLRDDRGLGRPTAEVTLACVAEQSHFIRLQTVENCPVPILNPMWRRWHEPSVTAYIDPYLPRNAEWYRLFPPIGEPGRLIIED